MYMTQDQKFCLKVYLNQTKKISLTTQHLYQKSKLEKSNSYFNKNNLQLHLYYQFNIHAHSLVFKYVDFSHLKKYRHF